MIVFTRWFMAVKNLYLARKHRPVLVLERDTFSMNQNKEPLLKDPLLPYNHADPAGEE